MKPAPPSFVYLASQSPRRSQLLQQIGVTHRMLPAGDEEDAEALEALVPGELPDVYVQRVTRLKLAAACRRLAQRGLPPAPVLCADTTVALGRRILGKPADAAEATDMLRRLSGRTHRVLTAVAVHDGRRSRAALQVSHVRFAGHAGGGDRGLRRQRRALRQGRRLCHPGRRRGLGGAYRRQPLRHHGAAAVRVRGCCCAPPAWPCRVSPRLHCHGQPGHPHQLGPAGDARGRRRERRRAGAAHRTHARTRPGRQRLPGQGGARAARHAERVHRHRSGPRRLPARGRPQPAGNGSGRRAAAMPRPRRSSGRSSKDSR